MVALSVLVYYYFTLSTVTRNSNLVSKIDEVAKKYLHVIAVI